ncbi:Clan SB, family S8, subtilisin-like serine peptidase [Tritrichomonas foetus]|uniref:Clan SB, family S8, subtilisin-like serine peptidase n=1 Tax=Tritrichomonas foetus TaxID=1144522 RepID=A0A1J4KH43_9EUKA|nr:Clan SB, family S8, subtilisin-like serine peptidase [Tritrichomonas foetus]|eukprot:OHT10362.1 Clan SB, family S8, subtilisin-like serine peptidase [Tritrichomonas foetus]
MMFFIFFASTQSDIFPLNNGLIINSLYDTKISKHKYAWYYLLIKNNTLHNFIKNTFNFQRKYLLPISNGLYSGYLSINQAFLLKTHYNVWIKKIPSSHKYSSDFHNFNSDLFYIIMTPDCHPPGEIIEKHDDFYVIYIKNGNQSLYTLSKMKCIRAFEPVINKIQYNTRFNKGKIYKMDSEIWKINEFFDKQSNIIPSRFSGEGECAIIADSGIDANSKWFYDDSPRSDFTKDYQLKHRKIKFALPYGDFMDYTGHGTFLAGIVSGNATCSKEAALYNGIAPKSKIVIQDIDKKGELYLPSNLSDISYFSKKLGCSVQLNAWSVNNQPLLTYLIDKFSYENPHILTIFGSDRDDNGDVSTPADAKNVLTVGSLYSDITSEAFTEKTSGVLLYITGMKHPIPGHMDPKGTPLLNSLIKSKELVKFTFSTKHNHSCLIDINSNEISDNYVSKYSKCSLLLVFDENAFVPKMNIPIIRLPKRWNKEFTKKHEVSIVPNDISSDQYDSYYNLRPESSKQSIYPFRIKPELIAPGGPIIGPKANSPYCDSRGLTIKSGPSVSASFVTGGALLISQWLHQKKKTVTSTLLRALLIFSAIHTKINNKLEIPDREDNYHGYGYGIPQLDTILNSNPFMHTGKLTANHAIFFSVKARFTGYFTAVLSFLDFPRDPFAAKQISANIQLYIRSMSGKGEIYIANHNNRISKSKNNKLAEDIEMFDFQNTNLKISVKVKTNEMYHIIIYPYDFDAEEEVNYSLVTSNGFGEIYGPIEYLDKFCPKQCQRHGRCVNGKCECVGKTYGDFCDFELHYLVNNEKYNIGIMKFGHWEYFCVRLSEWVDGTKIGINYQSLDTNNIEIYFWLNDVPTLSQSLCSLTKCKYGEIVKGNLLFNMSLFEQISPSDSLYIGVFAKRKSNFQNAISFSFVSAK